MVNSVERVQLISENCPSDATQKDCIAYINQCIAQGDEGRVQFELAPAKGDTSFVYKTLADCAAAAPSLARFFGPPRSLPAHENDQIPQTLTHLHEILAAEELQGEDPPEAAMERASLLVTFYGSWFPEEVRQQFELAHQALAGRQAGHVLMVLERVYAPNPERFAGWISRRQGEWNEKVGSWKALMNNSAVAALWRGNLSPQQQEMVKTLFGKAFEIVFSRTTDIGGEMELLQQMALGMLITSLAGIEEEEKRISEQFLSEEKLADSYVFFSGDASEALRMLRYAQKKAFSPAFAKRVWQSFFVERHHALCTSYDYWRALGSFMQDYPQFVGEFLAREDTCFEGWSYYVGSRKPHHDGVRFLFQHLLEHDLVPRKRRREMYLELLRSWGEGFFDVTAYERIADVDAMEERMIRDFLINESQEGDDFSSGEFGSVCQHLFVARAKEWGSQRTIAFLRKHLPPDLVHRLTLSFELIGFMVDQEPAAVASLLGQYQDRSRISHAAVERDPLWMFVWNAFCRNPLLHIFESPSDTSSALYERALDRIPTVLIDYGRKDIVKRFYFENHPYAPIYRLPPDLRPTGKGLSFVSIDSFYDPAVKPHSDKSVVAVVALEKRHWEDAEKFSHGVGTSSMAVGETMGLAPNAALFVAPIDVSGTQNFPVMILESLRRIIELKKQDPSVTVVGISLGLEVHTSQRNDAAASPIFRQMATACEELHRLGVAIVASAGNDGKKDHINMLGLLPHVRLVGAVDSKKTPRKNDDSVSAYSTGGDAVNRPELAAHADPVLFPVNGDKAMWLEQGGTSSAQPHFSGTLLLMKSVNPALSIDECLLILKQTADALQGDADTRGIDPMEALVVAAHLPGSIYEGERLERFSKALGYDSEKFRR